KIVTVPGALETPLALQRLAQSGDFDALVALGAVIRGDTYHFEIVANESAAGLSSVQLEFGIPIGNGILTCDTEEQARARMETKGYDAAQAAVELANLLDAIDEDKSAAPRARARAAGTLRAAAGRCRRRADRRGPSRECRASARGCA